MADFFEIDFIDVDSPKSGDAIAIRYELNGVKFIHVVDAGYQATGDKVVNFVATRYDNPGRIDHVVATHPDGDHAGGLRRVLEEFDIGTLWMLRPWIYANEIIHRFTRFNSAENLAARLKEIYPNIAALEQIAIDRNIPIAEPFQGMAIGAFSVLAPTKARYLDLVVESDRTPESTTSQASNITEGLKSVIAKVVVFAKAAWGTEVFSPEETSAENEMSVVQFAQLSAIKILLTADAGRQALREAADFAPTVGCQLPGISRFQVPHHGSRRNVSSELLDRWLGPKLASPPADGEGSFQAFICSSKPDTDHPRKSVVRALRHRGAKVYPTEGRNIWTHCNNAPARADYSALTPMDYPDENEE
jgi:beta-lactamase superfamily II metal-dependent hydrolase